MLMYKHKTSIHEHELNCLYHKLFLSGAIKPIPCKQRIIKYLKKHKDNVTN